MDIGIERGDAKRSYFYGSSKIIFWLIFLVLFFIFLIIYRVQTKYTDKIIEVDQIESPAIGLVFGAGLKAKGQPGAILEDRVAKAITLYQDGKIGKIVMSGDNSTANHNEVQAMKNYALDQGLFEDAIIMDHAGIDTFNSCKRYAELVGSKKVVLITQKYHLPRALYICNELGLDATGIIAESKSSKIKLKYKAREFFASFKAWFFNII